MFSHDEGSMSRGWTVGWHSADPAKNLQIHKQRNKAAGNASHLEESPKERIVWKGATPCEIVFFICDKKKSVYIFAQLRSKKKF